MSVDLHNRFERLAVHQSGRSLDASINEQQQSSTSLDPTFGGEGQTQGHYMASQQMRKQRSQRFSVPTLSQQPQQQQSAQMLSAGPLSFDAQTYSQHTLTPSSAFTYPHHRHHEPAGSRAGLVPPDHTFNGQGSPSTAMERSLSQESNPYSQASFEDPTPAHYAAPSMGGFNFAAPHTSLPMSNQRQQNTQLQTNHPMYNSNGHSFGSSPIYTQHANLSKEPQGLDYLSSISTNPNVHGHHPSNAPRMEPTSSRDRGGNLSSEWVRGQQQHHTGQPLGPPPQLGTFATGSQDDEVIPTAIVIKNIPFAAPRELLLSVMEDLRLPPPFAFNYHFDQGQFRGLAFANFRQAQDATLAVSALNGFDLQGRKLRAEFKKVLKEGEKERIERDKAIRRMRSTQQLVGSTSSMALNEIANSHANGVWGPGRYQNQTTFANPNQYGHPQYSNEEEDYGKPVLGSFSGSSSSGSALNRLPNSQTMTHQTFGMRQFVPGPPMSDGQYSAPNSAINGYSASPPSDVGTSVSARMVKQASASGSEISAAESSAAGRPGLDLNDQQSLEIFSRVLTFKDDLLRDELSFSRSLTASQRRIVHLVARKLGLEHQSVGVGDDRHIVVYKRGAGPTPTTSSGGLTPEPYPRSLRHSASTLGRQLSRDGPTGSCLNAAESHLPNYGISGNNFNNNLRGKKSMPDFRASQGYPGHPSFYHPGSTGPPPPLPSSTSFGGPAPSMDYNLLLPQDGQHQPYQHPNSRRSNMNLRDSYAAASNSDYTAMMPARQPMQGMYQQQQQAHNSHEPLSLNLDPRSAMTTFPNQSTPTTTTTTIRQSSSDGGSSSSPNLSLIGANGGPATDTSVSEDGVPSHHKVAFAVGSNSNVDLGGLQSFNVGSERIDSPTTTHKTLTTTSNDLQATTKTNLEE
ncbi:Peptidyl-prolyl cis-trans isomerase pin4 [Microbotryomycetes sp. JL221]|nr:Peptidyl-prolyl cis-trans isomerase pin4 [Microbotryomycetes sp. JL221]